MFLDAYFRKRHSHGYCLAAENPAGEDSCTLAEFTKVQLGGARNYMQNILIIGSSLRKRPGRLVRADKGSFMKKQPVGVKVILAVAEKPLPGHFPLFPWSWWPVWLRGGASHLLGSGKWLSCGGGAAGHFSLWRESVPPWRSGDGEARGKTGILRQSHPLEGLACTAATFPKGHFPEKHVSSSRCVVRKEGWGWDWLT